MRRDQTEELHITIPSLFKCPISMDLMKSPVSLCTGVTYDRNSIQKWLSQGHNTCPATMQILPSTDITPNLTLRNLIHLWLQPPPPPLSPPLITNLTSLHDKLPSLTNLADFLKFSQENRRRVAASKDSVMEIVKLMEPSGKLEVYEAVIMVIHLILSVEGAEIVLNELIFEGNRDILSGFILVLQKGRLDSRIKTAKVCELIAINSQSQRRIAEKEGLLFELYKLVVTENAVEAGLSAVLAVSTTRPVKKELVRFGIVRALTKILSELDSTREYVYLVEKVMKVLENVATCTEGRAAICEDEECAVEITSKLIKCSNVATAHGITVVWSVCCLARDERVKERVSKVNGLTKVLLVMQSDCSANVRQMCGELVKALGVKNGKSCLASYHTRTTHITPY